MNCKSFLLFLVGCCAALPLFAAPNSLRAPAYPLVSIDPYTSAWSMSDHLYDSPVCHWTGTAFPLLGVLKVDGTAYRFMGDEDADLVGVIPNASTAPWTGRYSFTEPEGEWTSAGYDDSAWKEGQGAFGTHEYPDIATDWTSEYIWVRRKVNLSRKDLTRDLFLTVSQDDHAEYYVNGVLARRIRRVCQDVVVPLSPEAKAALHPGENVVAVRCHNTGGWAQLDFGLMARKEAAGQLKKTAVQTLADVQATQTHYRFTCGPVELRLTFTAPLLMDDLDLLSRPVNYISYEAVATDGKKHDVRIYFEASPRWAVDRPSQETFSETFEKDGLTYLKAGTLSQRILASKGDDRRIDWGYFYLAGSAADHEAGIGGPTALRSAFTAGKELSKVGKEGKDADGRMALARRFGKTDRAEGVVLIGYDDLYSIQYFGHNLRPWWNRDGKKDICWAFSAAAADYQAVKARCDAFDERLMADAEQAGGRPYAELCALAYRQSVHAHKLVRSPQGDLLWLSKENNSNGSIGTVDVTYPSAPLYLLYNTELAKGLMNHIYYYSESGKWKKPFPSHDVGTYPLANGQTYGGDMPVEEAGNMLTLTAAVCHYEGNAAYAEKHWNVISAWTDYLMQFGLDPENQLCTDDFAGHFAHNANLSIKAILGIASYGYMARMLGKEDIAEEYTAAAREMAARWMEMADDGDHYRLTFDKSGTWSQKYNLVWDKLLGMDIFPDSVRRKEIAWYLKNQNEYGLPLDNRMTYTKTDWIVWTATMADSLADFQALVAPIHKFENETVDRVPMSDWVFTDSPTHRGFKARSVVGGYFIKMLENKR